MKKLLIVDCGNLAYRSVHVSVNQDSDDNYSFFLWRHLFLNSFLQTIIKFSPDRVILAIDSPENWRKELYKGYKLDRAAKRAKSNVNFDRFFPIMNTFLEDLQKTFTNIFFMKVDKTEADDIVATVCLRSEDTRSIIVSSDSDFHQLLSNNINQFNPFDRLLVESINPKRELQVKILTGDKSDCVPAVRPKVGPKTALKLIDGGLQDLLDSDEEVKKNYERNEQLIDLTKIPDIYSNEIWKKYMEYDVKEIRHGSIYNFLTKNKLQRIIDEWNSYDELIKKLK